MKTVQEYLRHADECDALARKAISTDQRTMISDMASTWRLLADQRKRKLEKLSQAPIAGKYPATMPWRPHVRPRGGGGHSGRAVIL